jgi:hypothetical protein
MLHDERFAPSKEACRTSMGSLNLTSLLHLECIADFFDFRCEANEEATDAMTCFDDLRDARHSVIDVSVIHFDSAFNFSKVPALVALGVPKKSLRMSSTRSNNLPCRAVLNHRCR